MSFLKKSLEKRIHELRTSIEAQKTELAAYEQVLALESGKPAEVVAVPAPVIQQPAAETAASNPPITVEFNGSRSDFVASVLKQRGSAGVTPHEISAAFAARKIAVSKNLVYNVLSLMFKTKRVRKSGGLYYPVAAKAKVEAPVSAPTVPAKPKKRRISEEGMRRIIAATKKRWALQRAAKAKGR